MENPKDLLEVGNRLKAAGYDDPTLAASLGLPHFADWRHADIPVYERRLDDAAPLAGLIRVFLFGHDCSRADLESVLSPGGVGALCAHGLMTVSGRDLHPEARLTPFAGLIFAHDPETRAIPEPDHVLGIGPATRTLHALTVRPRLGQALDVGTGCGVQALCLAQHADRVIATDVNRRALWFAGLNAALNGIDNVELRVGNLLEPVVDEMFDLVVANPPFVLSPDAAFVFRDAGQDGNVSRSLVSAVPSILRPGGFAQLLINWEVEADGDWAREPKSWIADTTCDGWLLAARMEDGLAYAAKWNAWLREPDPPRFAAALDRWRTYFADREITAVATGSITLRQRVHGTRWWRADWAAGEIGPHAGDQVRRVFAAQDQGPLQVADRTLLAMTPRFVDAHRLDQTLRYRDGAYVVDAVQLRLDDGVGMISAIEPQAMLVLLAIDGYRTLGQVLDEASNGLTTEEAETLARVTIPTVQHLVELGMMVLDEPMSPASHA